MATCEWHGSMTGGGKDNDTEDEALWQFAVQDVKPIHDRPKADKTLRPKAKGQNPASPAPIAIRVTSRDSVPLASRDMDRRTLQKLERGQMPIEAVLDLHGHSQAQAIDALHGFIPASAGRGLRCVLVITGKGRSSGGILRNSLGEWLDSPALAAFVLRAVPAKGRHGGGGAFYVYLRRGRR